MSLYGSPGKRVNHTVALEMSANSVVVDAVALLQARAEAALGSGIGSDEFLDLILTFESGLAADRFRRSRLVGCRSLPGLSGVLRGLKAVPEGPQALLL